MSWNKMLTVGALCSLWKISLGDLKNISSNFASVTNVCLSEPLSSRINPADQETLYFSKFLHGFVKTSWSKCSFPAFISEVDTNHIFRVLSIPSDPFQELILSWRSWLSCCTYSQSFPATRTRWSCCSWRTLRGSAEEGPTSLRRNWYRTFFPFG